MREVGFDNWATWWLFGGAGSLRAAGGDGNEGKSDERLVGTENDREISAARRWVMERAQNLEEEAWVGQVPPEARDRRALSSH